MSADIQSLKAELASLRARITEIEDGMSQHIGLDYGSSGMNYPHPNQQVAIAEYGGGVARLDTLSLQVAIPSGSTGKNIISGVDTFQNSQADLDAHYPRIFLIGIRTGNLLHFQTQVNRDNTGYVSFDMKDETGTASTLVWGVNYAGVFGSVEAKIDADDAYVTVTDNIFLWLGNRTSDPTYPRDGMIWYRDDFDRFFGRVNGANFKFQMEGSVNLGDQSELTVATGAITVTNSYHLLDTEADAGADDLDTINGGVLGQIYAFRAANSARTVTFKDGTGNLKMTSDFALTHADDVILMLSDGTNMYEVSRSNNET